MAEDTWALNEGVIDEDEFLKQSYLLMAEREAMFRNALEKTRRGVVACVFDTSDRVQHMFYRYLDRRHAARHGRTPGTIEDLYQRMDRLVGLALEHVDDGYRAVRALRPRVLLVPPRHQSERLAARHGYLRLKNGAAESGRISRAWIGAGPAPIRSGSAGLYLNLKGREAQGIVVPAPRPRR